MERVFVFLEELLGQESIGNITQSFGNIDLIRGSVALARE
jgi:hypothetical protein